MDDARLLAEKCPGDARRVKYLNHITLTSGHLARTSMADVTDETITALRPWLDRAIDSEPPVPLPGPLGSRDGFSAAAYTADGALVCTVYDPANQPLVTFGVAHRSRHAPELWALLVAQFGAVAGIKMPSTPWCAVAIHPAFATQVGVGAWIGDFERSLAWIWIA